MTVPQFMLSQEIETEDPARDWRRPSLAVVANTDVASVVLFTAGPHVRSFIDDVCSPLLDEHGIDGAPSGISVWEGMIRSAHYNTPDMNEYDAWLEGTFREPTDAEWLSICQGKCPWNDADWDLPNPK